MKPIEETMLECKQHMVIRDSRVAFHGEVNEMLLLGWKVVPGTLGAASLETYIVGDETSFDHVYWVVLSREEMA